MINITENEAKRIVLEWLIRLYGEDEGMYIFEAGKNTIFDYHGLAYKLGKESFHFFCEFFLHDYLFDYSSGKVPLSETHFKIWDKLQNDLLGDKNTKSVFVMPRGFAKTSACCIPLAIWTALYCIHPFVVIQSAIQPRADNFIEDIKMQIENNKIMKKCFGEYINSKLTYNSSAIELDIKPKRSKIQAVSSSSNIRGINYRGFRVGLLLLDDGQSDDDLNTDESRAGVVNRFNTVAMKALETQNYNVVAFGTVQKTGDLYDTLLKYPTWYSHIEKCCLVDDIDYYFAHNEHWQNVAKILKEKANNNDAAMDYYYQHQSAMDFPVIWEKFNCFELFVSYLENRVAFKKEYQCDIRNLGEKRIYSISAIPETDIETLPFVKTILSVDPAGTNKKKSDYYAFCVLSDTNNTYTDKKGYRHSIKYARKSIIDKLDYEEYINKVIDLLCDYTDINTISIEKNTYMGADVVKLRERIANHPQLQNRPLTIINKSRTQNKDNRIDAIIPDINLGRIIFNENDIEAIEQIKEFAGAAYTPHDDMIDCLADAIENISTISTGCNTYHFVSFRDIGYF